MAGRTAFAVPSALKTRIFPRIRSRNFSVREKVLFRRWIGWSARVRMQAEAEIDTWRGRKVTITTPLYYVNAPPHMGSAYPTIAADALRRFYEMVGADVMMVTGVDEHGEKVAAAAEAAGLDVDEHCEKITKFFMDLWGLLGVECGSFVRTTSPRHQKVVTEMVERVRDSGDVYRANYKGFYCTGCEEYKDESELGEGKVCTIHLTECKEREEENWFFRLSKYQHRLENFLEENPDFIRPRERKNEVMSWVKEGLRDFSISRANVKWGIPVPGDEQQTIYVWFDALIGYLSALLPEEEEGDGVYKSSLRSIMRTGRWPPVVHIIGKDILRFHAVYWLGMLMSAGLELPKSLYGHGFLTKDGLKMGKSLGNTLEPVDLVKTYGSDAVRYYFLRGIDFGSDGDFSATRFIKVVNADLANNLGNLLSRSVTLLSKYCNETLPFSSAEVSKEVEDLVQVVETSTREAYVSYIGLDFMRATGELIKITTAANVFFDRQAPWRALKGAKDEVRTAEVCLVAMLECVRVVGLGLSPVIPGVAKKVYEALGLAWTTRDCWQSQMKWGVLEKGLRIVKGPPVFMRMEMDKIDMGTRRDARDARLESPRNAASAKAKKATVQSMERR